MKVVKYTALSSNYISRYTWIVRHKGLLQLENIISLGIGIWKSLGIPCIESLCYVNSMLDYSKQVFIRSLGKVEAAHYCSKTDFDSKFGLMKIQTQIIHNSL